MPKGSRVVLYGSRARGDHRQDSDWDIHIIVPGQESLTLQEIDDFAYPLEMVGWDFEEYISTCVYSDHDWNLRKNLPFYQNVEKDKIIVFQN